MSADETTGNAIRPKGGFCAFDPRFHREGLGAASSAVRKAMIGNDLRTERQTKRGEF